VTSGSPVVFVDDAAEYVAPADLAGAWLLVAEQWGRELASAVRARLVVVTHVGAEHRFQVTFRVDEQVEPATVPSTDRGDAQPSEPRISHPPQVVPRQEVTPIDSQRRRSRHCAPDYEKAMAGEPY
jgi:hypothetical protein